MSVFDKISNNLLLIILPLVLMIPPLKLAVGFPAVEVTDLLLPFVLFKIIVDFKKDHFFSTHKYFIVVFGLFLSFIFLSIAINGRLFMIRDYFEILKVIKWLVFALFIANSLTLSKLDLIIKSGFLMLLIINLVHYYNLFDFNVWGEIFYTTEEQLKYFGINSLGFPGPKRMIGTMGNPNNNAIMFLMFTIYFLVIATKKQSKLDFLFYILSLILLIFCQSRTSFLTLIIVLIAHFILVRNYKHLLYYFCLPIVYFIVPFLNFQSDTPDLNKEELVMHINNLLSKESEKFNLYRNKQFEVIDYYKQKEELKEQAFQEEMLTLKENQFNNRKEYLERFLSRINKEGASEDNLMLNTSRSQMGYLNSAFEGESYKRKGSLGSRYMIWNFLFKEIKEAPFFGHAPNKEYFYKNGFYSENEFILILWRYGVFGFLCFISIALYPLIYVFIRKKDFRFDFVILFGLAFLVCCLTNNPFSGPKMVFLWSFVLGVGIVLKKNISNEKTIIDRG